MFSKKAYAEALPNKEAITVAKAMEKIIDDQIFYVSSIRSDNGSEFIAKEFKEMLAKYNIKQVLSLPGKPQSLLECRSRGTTVGFRSFHSLSRITMTVSIQSQGKVPTNWTLRTMKRSSTKFRKRFHTVLSPEMRMTNLDSE